MGGWRGHEFCLLVEGVVKGVADFAFFAEFVAEVVVAQARIGGGHVAADHGAQGAQEALRGEIGVGFTDVLLVEGGHPILGGIAQGRGGEILVAIAAHGVEEVEDVAGEQGDLPDLLGFAAKFGPIDRFPDFDAIDAVGKTPHDDRTRFGRRRVWSGTGSGGGGGGLAVGRGPGGRFGGFLGSGSGRRRRFAPEGFFANSS